MGYLDWKFKTQEDKIFLGIQHVYLLWMSLNYCGIMEYSRDNTTYDDSNRENILTYEDLSGNDSDLENMNVKNDNQRKE